MSLASGKVVAITGASRGIGRGCAVEFAKHGAKAVVIHYLGDDATTGEAKELKTEVEALGAKASIVPGDISNPETSNAIVQTAVETYGRLDVLVSNAGICPFSEFLDMSLETYHLTRAVNTDGSFYVVQAAARQMKAQEPQGGSIIQISSWSAYGGGAQQVHYTPTKAAVLSLMQSCAVALGKYNIRCNAVLPGTIETAINKEDLANEEKRAYMAKRIPLGRLGAPSDVAGPVVFFSSDLAKYCTGSALLVDGGAFVALQ